MLSLNFSIRFLTAFAIATGITCQSYAQLGIDNVISSFNSISAKPDIYFLNSGKIKIPAGGHLQGIQIFDSSKVVLTASSGSYSYYMTADMGQSKRIKEIQSISKISDSPFRHAGGCQVYNNQLLVGIEDNMAKDKSKIVLVSLTDTLKNKAIKAIAERNGKVKRETAGATGFMKLSNCRYLVAVGDWSSRNIDFYTTGNSAFDKLDSLTTFNAPENEKWPSYQSINLVTDKEGNIYLLGFALDGTKNRADLFKVTLSKDNAQLLPITTRYFKCKHGAGFRFGSGVAISGKGCIAIICCCRNAGHHTAINIFN